MCLRKVTRIAIKSLEKTTSFLWVSNEESLFVVGCIGDEKLPMWCENYFITHCKDPVLNNQYLYGKQGRIFFVAPVILATTSQFHGEILLGEKLRRWKPFNRTSKRAWPMLKMQSLRAEDEVVSEMLETILEGGKTVLLTVFLHGCFRK